MAAREVRRVAQPQASIKAIKEETREIAQDTIDLSLPRVQGAIYLVHLHAGTVLESAKVTIKGDTAYVDSQGLLMQLDKSTIVKTGGTIVKYSPRAAPKEIGLKNLSRYKRKNRPSRETAAVIRGYCLSEWGAKQKMVAHCIKEQTIARRKVATYRGGIRSRCEQKWHSNFRMVVHCIEEQTTAKRNINSMYGGSKRKQCEQKWGTDYRMVEHCIEG